MIPLWDRIRQRKVVQWALAYLAGSWLVLQVVDVLGQNLDWPGWFFQVTVALLAAGFLAAIVLAWYHGEKGRQRVSGVEVLMLAGILVIAGAAVTLVWGETGPTREEPAAASREVDAELSQLPANRDSTPSVAVLPFDNFSPDPNNAYFADGIHEDILAHLSKIRGLTVLARTSVLRYRDTRKSIREIAAELGADALLEGSVRRAGDQVRIVTQLIDPRSEGHLWAETYDRRLEVDNVFAVQTEVARQVTRALQVNLAPEEDQRIAKRPTGSLAAYDLYLQAREAYNQYEDEENDEAIRLFRRALEVDPDYAQAWAGLGDAFGQRVERFGYPRAWADSAERYARRAIELDPELAEGHKALALAFNQQDRARESLEANLRAVELDPNHWGAANNLGADYLNLGRYDEAVRWYRRSARLAPNNFISLSNLAYAYTYLRMEQAAGAWLERALAVAPDRLFPRLLRPTHAVNRGDLRQALAHAEQIVQDESTDAGAWTGAAGIAYMAREFDRAIDWARESLRLAPDNSIGMWHSTEELLGLSLLKAGDRAEGLEVLQEPMDEAERRIYEGAEDNDFFWLLAAAHAALGEEDTALEWLERAYDAGFRHARWVRIEPAFDDLRDDPRLEQWVERVESDIAAMRERVVQEGLAAETP